MTEQDSVGPITVRLPPEPTLARVVRLAAGGVAGLAGFSVDRIDDIRIVVSEVLVTLIEHGQPPWIDVRLQVDDGRFMVHGTSALDCIDADNPDLVLSATVLRGVAADFGIEADPGNQLVIWAAVDRSANHSTAEKGSTNDAT
jgi:hypothetical protein